MKDIELRLSLQHGGYVTDAGHCIDKVPMHIIAGGKHMMLFKLPSGGCSKIDHICVVNKSNRYALKDAERVFMCDESLTELARAEYDKGTNAFHFDEGYRVDCCVPNEDLYVCVQGFSPNAVKPCLVIDMIHADAKKLKGASYHNFSVSEDGDIEYINCSKLKAEDIEANIELSEEPMMVPLLRGAKEVIVESSDFSSLSPPVICNEDGDIIKHCVPDPNEQGKYAIPNIEGSKKLRLGIHPSGMKSLKVKH